MADPIALMLVPRTIDGFIQYDQGQDLLRSPSVVGIEAPRVPYGVLGRLPDTIADALAAGQARRLKLPGEPRVAMIFHPFQLPLARGILARWPECELWYGIWDLYTEAGDAGPRTRRRLDALHAETLERAAFTFALSPPLADAAAAAGHEPAPWPSAADSFPAPDPGSAVIAVCFGNLGRRTDWALLREITQGMPELSILLVGNVAEDEVKDDPDFSACREAPGIVWLGRRPNEELARLILCADVGLSPLRRDPFNEAALPNRILKAARLGRKTISPDFPGVTPWEPAVIRADGAQAWIDALRGEAGRRSDPDTELRDWALQQTGARSNAPLWERLAALGIRPG